MRKKKLNLPILILCLGMSLNATNEANAAPQKIVCMKGKALFTTNAKSCPKGMSLVTSNVARGEPGNDGAEGPEGAPGPEGSEGLGGPVGAQGTQGAIGQTGAVGLPGEPGTVGPNGITPDEPLPSGQTIYGVGFLVPGFSSYFTNIDFIKIPVGSFDSNKVLIGRATLPEACRNSGSCLGNLQKQRPGQLSELSPNPCAGDENNPTALPGYVCVYLVNKGDGDFNMMSASASSIASGTNTSLFANVIGLHTLSYVWAYTAK